MRDLKYLFAYTIPLATWVSITSQGVTFAAPIYVYFYSHFRGVFGRV